MERRALAGRPRRLRASLRLLWRAYALWLRADCGDLSAAFAYHTLQSFFPALLILLALASRVLGSHQEVLGSLLELVARVLPPSSLQVFEGTLQRFTRQGPGAGLLGVVLLVLSASNIYLTLQRGADRIWWNRPFGFEGMPWQQIVRRYIGLRLKALSLLLLVGGLLLLDQFISNLRFLGSAVIRGWVLSWIPSPWWEVISVSRGVDQGLSLLLTFLAALVLLWMLPSRRIPLRPLLPAAALASLSITLLNLLLGRSLLVLGLRFQAYGIVGGVLILTLWVWLVGVILYYAQCLAVVLARRPAGGHSAPPSGPPTPLRKPG
ncbi:MAG: YhjD/YihY/BrkB family envelope integrity protein [Synechococcaceae cyanobacterium]|nr:YhjD/YihY/BrkB family envelope integrity protein [Synechococcaceae cyanobacterium]